ncbi:UDP-4-amino-4,6-dideoxy-N-acetyl-beta-L-altrosamine transaminase [Microbacterium sp. HJ5]
MSIPYGRQWIDDADVSAVVDALRSEWLTTGPAVATFEQSIAAEAGADAAIAVSSGTAALHAAYAAARVGEGDVVLTTPLTFVATAATAAQLGARIEFADVDPATGNLDPAAAEAAMTDRTRVVAAVDYAGHPVELDELRSIAHARGALLLEDAAHSIGSTYRGAAVGSIADITTFSFFPTKNLTTAEGGAVVTSDARLADGARAYRTHGLVRDPERQRMPDEGPWHQEVHEFGLNYRLPDVLAALGTSQLSRLAMFKQRRTRIFERYSDELADLGLTLPVKHAHVDPMWHLYPLRVPAADRRRIFEELRARGILVQVNYIPVYWHPVFEDLGYRRGLCPVAEQYYREEISLPMYAALTDDDQSRVIDAVREVLA